MPIFESLRQGGSFKEGFNSRQKIDKELDDFFVDANELKVDGLSFDKIVENVQRDYNTLFCLKPAGTPGEGEEPGFEQAEEGDCIWQSLNSEELCTGDAGKCNRPPTRSNLDKIIKEGGNYYYINKYGYKKPLGSNKNDFDPTCLNKTTLENNDGGEYLSSSVYFNDNLSSTMKSCTNGNYNLEFCKSDGNCDYAYYSPKGEVKIYGNKTWKDLKNTQCGTLPIVNVKTSGDTDESSFANTNSGNEKWGQRDTLSFSDELGKSKLEEKTNIEKAKIIKGCLPFHGENSLSGYQKNLENKLLSEVQVREMQKKWTEKLNKANKMFFNDGNDGTNSALKEEIKEWYSTDSDYCKQINGERVCLDRHELSENYRKKINKLNSLQEIHMSRKNLFKEKIGRAHV